MPKAILGFDTGEGSTFSRRHCFFREGAQQSLHPPVDVPFLRDGGSKQKLGHAVSGRGAELGSRGSPPSQLVTPPALLLLPCALYQLVREWGFSGDWGVCGGRSHSSPGFRIWRHLRRGSLTTYLGNTNLETCLHFLKIKSLFFTPKVCKVHKENHN